MLRQMQAVLGRRMKPSYTSAINAQLPYLPALRARQEDIDYRNKMHKLSERGFGLEQDRVKELRRQGETARNLGYANLGIGAGMGLMNAMNAPDAAVPDVAESVVPEAINAVNPVAELAGVGEQTTDFTDYVPDFLKNIYEDTIGSVFESIGGLFE